MKKLLAIVLAMLLLTASTAFAETATVMTYSDPVITVTQDGQTNTADLTGTNLTIAMGLAGEEPAEGAEDTRVPTVVAVLEKDGQTLLSGELQIIDNRLVIDADGLSRPIAADMSMAGDMAGQGYMILFQALPELTKAKLPAFTGVDIPKIGLLGVADTLSTMGIQAETTDNSASFELPAEIVNYLLQMFLAQAPAEAVQSLGIDQLLANGGFALKGDITDDGTTATLVLGIYPVEGESTAEEPFIVVTFASAANSDVLTVDMSMSGQSMTLGQLALTSLPEQAELDLSLDLMGAVSMVASLYPDNGAQVAALEVSAADQKLNASLVYGEDNGADYADFAFSVQNQAAVDVYVKTTGDGNGNEEGTCTVTIDSLGEPQSNVVVDGRITQNIVEGYAFANIENAAGAIDVTAMTEEENAQISQEFSAILGNVMAAFGAIDVAA